MILEKMYPGEVREVDCHCPTCTLPILITVKQQNKEEIELKVIQQTNGQPMLIKKAFMLFARKGRKRNGI